MVPAGPYVATVIGAITTALAASASQMYLSAALRSDDQGKAQSSLTLFSVIAQNAGRAAYTALFYGDKALMTSGYLLAAAVGVPLFLAAMAFPRQLPATPSIGGEEPPAQTVIILYIYRMFIYKINHYIYKMTDGRAEG